MKNILMLIAIGFFCYGASAFAADTDAKQPQPRMQSRQNFIASLNLTDAQKKDMGKLRTEMEKKAVELRAKAQTARIELRELLMADTPDKSAIGKKMDEVAKREADLRMNRIDGWFETNKLLTPEQQKLWVKALRFGTARAMRQSHGANGRAQMMSRPMRPMRTPAAPPSAQ
jgi:Spy/CpxP family protein refolding chaperone